MNVHIFICLSTHTCTRLYSVKKIDDANSRVKVAKLHGEIRYKTRTITPTYKDAWYV